MPEGEQPRTRNESRRARKCPGPSAAFLLLLVPLWVVSLPALAQTPSASDLVDEITVTQLGAGSSPAPQPLGASASEPVNVSMLDILTKLALLVLGVYGIAWGVNAARRSGFRLGGVAPAAQNMRLRECECLRLGSTGSLHLVEVDRRPVLVASSPTGEVSLVLDLAAASQPAPTPQPEPAPAPELQDDVALRLESDLQADRDWAERRDSLIRALAQQG